MAAGASDRPSSRLPFEAAGVALTKALAPVLAKDGIRVNSVAPGPVWTPL